MTGGEREQAHRPVLLDTVVELLRPGRSGWIADCTVGLAGHARALLEAGGGQLRLVGVDQDVESLRVARERLTPWRQGDEPAVRLFHATFDQLPDVLHAVGVDRIDGLLADLGVSSPQFDKAHRGFSFSVDGPLDMRMDAESDDPTAAELVNGLEEGELADLLYRNADERDSRRIARAIVAAREAGPITRTLELADIVARAVRRRGHQRIHPATRTFQALRIAVNREMERLDALLNVLPDVLAPEGRAVIISFHSLEDRRVKQAFSAMKSANLARIVTPKPLVPDDEEIQGNPRSRSAKLRCVERL